ncbi:SLY1 [Ecytonucleospora hepatopenaei]|uniref:SLY1 n=1 Tax=Ecytonucleospora hepatopenaei TaxID=646526 RepID=A0A1W0E922_9MICR|nr:SLY1 [Ecytonucleospora hepatopenaei]
MIRKIQKQHLLEIFKIKDEPFRVLLLDEYTKQIISPLFTLSELREAGICAYFMLGEKINKVEEIPAIVYAKDFTLVTQEIVKLNFCSYYVYCSYQIKRNDLQNLACKLGEFGEANRIKNIYDTFTNFVSLQDNLFTLNCKNSYLKDYSREASEGLYSVFETLGKRPFMVGNMKNASEGSGILKLLNSKFKTTKTMKFDVKNPLLILMDREFDLFSPIMHTLGFLELIHDVFTVSLNKVNAGDLKYNLDVESDLFKKQWFNEFVDVVDLVNNQVITCKKELALKNLNVNDVSKILEVAPELQKKNEEVNNLLNISLKVVQEIKKRSLDEFYEMEHNFDKEKIMELSEKGSNEDILRFCVSLLGTKNDNLIGPMLKKRNISTKCIDYLNKFLQKDTGYGSFLTNKMKSFFNGKTNAMVSYVEDILLQIKNNSLENTFETCTDGEGIQLDEISEIIIFCNGGVTYKELACLKKIEEKYKIPVILGSTEILNAQMLINQIESIEI